MSLMHCQGLGRFPGPEEDRRGSTGLPLSSQVTSSELRRAQGVAVSPAVSVSPLRGDTLLGGEVTRSGPISFRL